MQKECTSHQVEDYFNKKTIIHEVSCSYAPPQDIIIEKNYHIVEVTRAFLFQRHVPKKFWSEDIPTSVYLINRMSTRI